MKVLIEVSARHIHLSQKDLEALFGENYSLNKIKDLSQPGEFAAKETLTLVGPKKNLENVRIIGPVRENTQVELSITDCFFLGVKPVIKVSGNLAGTEGIKIIGPKNELVLEKGVIVPQRHLHIETAEAEKNGLKTGDIIRVKVEGERGLIFDNVAVRTKDNYVTAVHLDTDEGNAAGVKGSVKGEIIE